jgi:hypothetical protein
MIWGQKVFLRWLAAVWAFPNTQVKKKLGGRRAGTAGTAGMAHGKNLFVGPWESGASHAGISREEEPYGPVIDARPQEMGGRRRIGGL